MASSLAIRPRARQDITEITAYFDRQRTEVGDRFLADLEATFHLLLTTPRIGGIYLSPQPILIGVRVFPLRSFPNHLVFYFPKDDGIEIVRILHGARDLNSALKDI